MVKDDSKLKLFEIEELERKYLNKYWYFLKFVEDEIIRGFNTKNDIKSDWIGKYGTKKSGISDFAVGSERIIYALLNGKIAGQPNSAPVSSDLFFEVDDAFIHIDLKSVITGGGVKTNPNTNIPICENIGDYKDCIFIGENQNSYAGTIIVKTRKKGLNGQPIYVSRKYVPNLPYFYTKSNGEKKVTLTYFITILSNSVTLDTELISIMCMPNGKLEQHYKSRPLKAGKNPEKVRFNFSNVPSFELLPNQPKRIKIVYINPNMNKWTKGKLKFYLNNAER